MPSYILDPKGNIIKKLEEEGYVDVEIDSFSKENISDSFSSTVTKNEAYGITIKENPDVDNDTFGLIGKSTASILESNKRNPNFAFIENQNENVRNFRSFNNYKDSDVFASEFEIVGGVRKPLETGNYLTWFLDYFFEIFGLFAICEAFVSVNGLIQGENSVEEKYSLKMGNNTLISFDIFSDYIFNILNYPKDSREIIMMFSERIACFFLGFNEFLNPDNTIKINEITKDFTSFNNIIDLATGDVKNNSGLNEVVNAFILQPLAFGIITLLETFLTLNLNSEKRLLLIIRKFGFERIWNNNLHSAKKNIDEGGSNLFRELDFYKFRFAIERMHVGKKILRYHAYNSSPLTHRLREAPHNRLGISKSKFKADIAIASKDGLYVWDIKKSGNVDDVNNDFVDDFAQGTRIRALPQLLNLNASYVASVLTNKAPEDDTVLEVGKDLLQNFYFNKSHRIPDDLAKKIENHLESEYMPFYFRDLRTNEIISFHAFLDNISDTFSADYSQTTGFGRIDEVRAYTKTTRSISLGFTVAATSPSDHDLMWYQINKLISMCYPQWSDGVDNEYKLSNDKKAKGKYPFSQVITASPLIRLRVGDVIKSNYSKSSLSRLHGAPFDSNSEELDADIKKLTKEYSNDKKKNEKPAPSPLDSIMPQENHEYLLPGTYRKVTASGFGGTGYIHLKNHTKIKKAPVQDNPFGFLSFRKEMSVKIDDENSAYNETVLVVDRRSIIVKTPLANKDNAPALPLPIPGFGSSEEVINEEYTKNKEILQPNLGDAVSNPIVRAFESGMGRGLAGFITQLDLQYADSTWETGRIGSKAPIFLKLNVTFTPVHDIAPGIDHNGMMRAPTHNIGKLNNEMYGDPYDINSIGDGRKEAEKVLGENEKKANEG